MKATVIVHDRQLTGHVYHVRENGWPCIVTATGTIASGPEAPDSAPEPAYCAQHDMFHGPEHDWR